MLEVRNLVKKYGSFTAVNDLSFTVAAGSTFAFLGTNGAGKTTTISCLTTLIRPSGGQILFAGEDIRRNRTQVRRRIGVVFQESVLDARLSAERNLRFRAGLYGLSRSQINHRLEELSESIGLKEILRRPYGKLSGGQRRRVDIARALMHEPAVLFLDEPTTGLDAHNREMVWACIHDLRKATGLTVFLTTHYLEETENADQICIIDAGKLVSLGTPAQLRSEFSRTVLSLKMLEVAELMSFCARNGIEHWTDKDRLSLVPSGPQEAIEILRAYREQIVDFEYRHGSMDDVFVALSTGGHF